MTTANKLVDTMKHLGDATSHNLDYSYRDDVPVSFGEETITESNLLELHRRHCDAIKLRTFTKYRESKLGADWQWYIVGHERTLAMRVQAKRIQCDDKLKIRHTVGGSGYQQLDLLKAAAGIDFGFAKNFSYRPMYCIYCTERQRTLWKQVEDYQPGCLFIDANDLSLDTKSLQDIESSCWPWHFFFEYDRSRIDEYIFKANRQSTTLAWDGPTIRDLNEETNQIYNPVGVWSNNTFDLRILTSNNHELLPKLFSVDYTREERFEMFTRGIVVIDVT